MSFPKIFIGITLYDGKDYIFPQMYERLQELSYPNYTWLIVDNSKGFSYLSKLRKRGVKNVVHVNRGGNSRLALAKSQNLIRQKFLESSCDYLFMWESDLIPPKNVLEKLLSHNVPVVGSWYLIGTEGLKLPCIFVLDKKSNGLVGTRLIGMIDNDNGKFYDKYEPPLWTGQGLKQCHGCGLGATLIRRDIMDKEVFWYDERFDDKHSDVYFYLSLQNRSVPVFVDTDLQIPHYPSRWADVSDR